VLQRVSQIASNEERPQASKTDAPLRIQYVVVPPRRPKDAVEFDRKMVVQKLPTTLGVFRKMSGGEREVIQRRLQAMRL
jgi:hypothetical protein